jgi:hypothetical protein
VLETFVNVVISSKRDAPMLATVGLSDTVAPHPLEDEHASRLGGSPTSRFPGHVGGGLRRGDAQHGCSTEELAGTVAVPPPYWARSINKARAAAIPDAIAPLIDGVATWSPQT